MDGHHRTAGLTLIELMVTLAILAVLTALASPNWRDYQRSSALTAATSELVGLLASARSEALKRNIDVLLSPLAPGDWAQGWHLYVDADLSGDLSEGDTTLRTTLALNPEHLRLQTNVGPSIRYSGNGFATWGGTLELRRTDLPSTQLHGIRRIIVSASGRVRSCTPSSEPDPNCKAPS